MYKQLTAADRGAIAVLLQEQYTQKAIAGKLGVHPSTVSLRINKRSTPNGYQARSAQSDYERRRKNCKQKKKMNYSKRQKHVTSRLEWGWSPEQISGRLEEQGRYDLYICPETIYQWLYQDDWARKEHFYQYLRYGRKKRKKQTGRSVHRCKVPNRVSIDERPPIVEERSQYGHWEADSVIYPNKMAINTLNELSTGRVKFTKLNRKTALLTAQAMIDKLQDDIALTITLDNGSEMFKHQLVSQATQAKIYFCDPYTSWQRGANENVNMLLRGYLPKKQDISQLTQQELDDIAEELNNRPRKRLGYKTPNEVYQSMLKSKKGDKIALGSRI